MCGLRAQSHACGATTGAPMGALNERRDMAIFNEVAG